MNYNTRLAKKSHIPVKSNLYLSGCNFTVTSIHTTFSRILWMIFCVPDIFIIGNFPTQSTQLNTLPFKVTFWRTVIVVLFWPPFHRWSFLLVIISISAYLCQEQQCEEPGQDTTHYTLEEFFWGSHFCEKLAKSSFVSVSLREWDSLRDLQFARRVFEMTIAWMQFVGVWEIVLCQNHQLQSETNQSDLSGNDFSGNCSFKREDQNISFRTWVSNRQ